MDGSSSPLSSVASSAFSSPLSEISKTPSLPSLPNSPTMPMPNDAAKRYPSPSSTVASGTQSPIKLGEPIHSDGVQDGIVVLGDAAPPAKRRRMAPPPKQRTTEYLDLTKPDSEVNAQDRIQMERLSVALHKKKKIVVIAGAGISVSAGIPDFRSSTGLFASTKNQKKLKASGKHLFDASVYKHDATTQSFHTMVREMAAMTQNAKPTPFHHLLASLAREGRLMRLYSQNIDCIDTSMKPLATNVPLNSKGPWPTTIQLHGGLEKMVCTKCAQLEAFNGNVFDGPEAPLCNACKLDDEVRTTHAGKRSHGIGRLRPRFVLYNEYNPDEEAIGNVSSADLKARPDAVIVVGTTLKVPGTRRLVKELCQVTRDKKNGLTIWINTDSEPKGADFKDCWDIVVRSKCDDVARLAALPPWDCSIGDDYLVSYEEDLQGHARRSRTTFTVRIPSSPPQANAELASEGKPKQIDHIQGIPTPRASPNPSVAKQVARKKQSKIEFGGKEPEEDKSAIKVKASKPRARRTKQPAKASAPKKNTLTKTFKAVKNVNNPIADKKLVYETARAHPLPPLRPEVPSSRDNMVYERESGDAKTFVLPCTPAQSENRSRETISPTSWPKSFESLIDVSCIGRQ